jgi:predicted MFS family arabinose efflux permease
VFLFLEARARAPMLPLHLFRSKNFTGANLLTFFLYAGLGGALFFFPLNLIQVQDYSATAAGAAFLPFTFILFFLSRWSGGLINRYGARMPLIAGPLLTAAGFVLFAVPSVNSNYWTTFFPAVTVLGIGMAISIAPLTTTVMNSVHASQSGTASGINNAVARTAGLLAVAIFGAIILSAFSKRLDERLSQIAISSEVRSVLTVNRSQLAALRPPPHIDGQTREVVQHAIETSFVSGFRLIMLAAAILALISALIAWLTIESRPYHTQSATQDNSE